MGLLDTIADTTRNNTRSLGGLLGLGDSGNGLLSDLDLAKRNALSRLRYNVGKNLQSTADYLSGDPNHWMRQPATPEDNARMDQALMDFGSGLMPGGLAGKIDVSHGSPHKFDRFDFTKIGTGEGAQAYGHGGYFAQGFDSPVAKDYQQALSAKEGMQPTINGKMLGEFYMNLERKANKLPPKLAEPEYEKLAFLEDLEQQPSFQHALDRIDDERIIPWAESLRSAYKPAGNLYNVELKWPDAAREASDPLGEHHLLDWDAPMSQQPSYIKKKLGLLDAPSQERMDEAISNMMAKAEKLYGDKYAWTDLPEARLWERRMGREIGRGQPDVSGAEFYRGSDTDFLHGATAPENERSQYLRSLGIPGIRYLDQGSRSAGTGSRNFVIFDDRIPQIITRNGKSLLED